MTARGRALVPNLCRRNGLPVLGLILIGLLVCSGQLLAQETYQESGDEGEVSEGEHKNHLAVFLGVTVEEDENAFSLGVDYERRVSRRFGIGALVDYASGDVRAFVVGLPVFIHATDRLRFIVAVKSGGRNLFSRKAKESGIMTALQR